MNFGQNLEVGRVLGMGPPVENRHSERLDAVNFYLAVHRPRREILRVQNRLKRDQPRHEDPLDPQQLTVELEQPLTGEELDALYAAHPHLIAVNPIYPDIQREQREAEESASLSVLERFAAFARDSEGVEPDEALLAAFVSLLDKKEGDDEL